MEKMRKLAKHDSGVSFSEDIITEIFLWLPLKSLIRFKRLSKRWYFLITHKDSCFRFNYLSALSTRRGNRIVGSDDFQSIMPGFFYQRPEYWRSYDRVRFVPTTTSTHIPEGTTTAIEIINNINPFLSLDKSLDKFLSSCLHQDQDQKIFIAASSNGFLLCSLERRSPETYYLVNPVTMEWVALPKLQSINKSYVHVGFVCKGDYPSLNLVEYTIVRVSWLERGVELLFNLFFSGDNQWREYSCSCQSLPRFTFPRHRNRVIVRTPTNSDDQGGGIVVYLLVIVNPTMAIAILVFYLNNGVNLLQMIETPGPDRGRSVLECVDYIREFDDDGVIHYVRLCCSTDFEFWVLNTETRDLVS